MRKVVVNKNVSLDGVMQAPGRPDEDVRGGFKRGGSAQPHNDPVMGRFMGQAMGWSASLLLGRRTYEDFFTVWSGRTDNPFSQVLDESANYVCLDHAE